MSNCILTTLRAIKSGEFLFRRKQLDDENICESKLARVLTTLDLTALGLI